MPTDGFSLLQMASFQSLDGGGDVVMAGPVDAGAAAAAPHLVRAAAPATRRHARFLVKERKYTQQYSHVYTRRLQALRGPVVAAVAARWGGRAGGAPRVVDKIIDIKVRAARFVFVWVGGRVWRAALTERACRRAPR